MFIFLMQNLVSSSFLVFPRFTSKIWLHFCLLLLLLSLLKMFLCVHPKNSFCFSISSFCLYPQFFCSKFSTQSHFLSFFCETCEWKVIVANISSCTHFFAFSHVFHEELGAQCRVMGKFTKKSVLFYFVFYDGGGSEIETTLTNV